MMGYPIQSYITLWEFYGITTRRCTGYGCYEGLILLPLAAFGMIMTISYLLISMFKK
tara:strand:+ start:1091 stop:1261 length:171 start_codon:yes stop_codon:yes gene_type:complete